MTVRSFTYTLLLHFLVHLLPFTVLGPQNPPVAWDHPCNSTLVAHESCLLAWIQSAQQDAARAGNALKP